MLRPTKKAMPPIRSMPASMQALPARTRGGPRRGRGKRIMLGLHCGRCGPESVRVLSYPKRARRNKAGYLPPSPPSGGLAAAVGGLGKAPEYRVLRRAKANGERRTENGD